MAEWLLWLTAGRQYTAGPTQDPPEPADGAAETTRTSKLPPDTDPDFLNFDPSSEAPEFMNDYLEQSDTGDVEVDDDYNSDAQTIFDQKASK